jgi:hypothetical protein
MDAVAMLTSVALQYGVPLENLVAKFRGVHFEPAGLTGNPSVPVASSLVDYIFRWLELRFLAPKAVPEPATRAAGPRKRNKKDAPAANQPMAPQPSGRASHEPRAPASNPETSTASAARTAADLVFAEGRLVCRLRATVRLRLRSRAIAYDRAMKALVSATACRGSR